MAFDANDLSPHEHFVMERARDGEIADFTPMAGPDGAKPAVRAGFIRKLMLGLNSAWTVPPPGVRIKGAQIDGAVDLTDCSGSGSGSLPALSLELCNLPDGLDVSRARLASLTLRACRLRRLDAAGTSVEGDVCIAGATPSGAPGAETFSADLSNARIGGDVDASGASLARAREDDAFVLSLDNAEVRGDVRLNNGFEALGAVSLVSARIAGALRCNGAQLLNRTDNASGAALIARSARIGGDIELADLKAEGRVDFTSARAGGDVDLARAVIRNEFGEALLFAHAHVDGTFAGAAKIHGQVSLRSAEIARDVDLKGIEIANPLTPRADKYEVALDAVSLAVGGAALLQGANIKGDVVLADARIAGALMFGGGRFINGGGWAIRAPNIRVGGDLTLKIDEGGFAPHGQKTVIEGGASYERASIAGALAWVNLELRGPGPDGTKGGVFSVADAEVAGPLRARGLVTHQEARIDLAGARCAALDDDLNTGWGVQAARLDLEDFHYQRIASVDERWRHRLAWLKRTGTISPQPYVHVAQLYARAGRREQARRILLAQKDLHTRSASSGPISWLFSSLFGLIAGYGLAPIRMARALVLFIAIGIAGVFAMNAQGALVTPDGRQCAGAVEPALYAIDVALPVIDLGQESRCAPGRTARAELSAGMEVSPYSDWRIFEGVAVWRWAHALYAILGAILTVLAALTFSGVLRPRKI